MNQITFTILLVFFGILAGLFLGRRSQAARKSLLEIFIDMRDDDQMMLLAVFSALFCIPTGVLILLVIILTRTFDAVAIGVVGPAVTILLGGGLIGIKYFFEGAHAGKKGVEAAMAEPSPTPTPAAGAGAGTQS